MTAAVRPAAGAVRTVPSLCDMAVPAYLRGLRGVGSILDAADRHAAASSAGAELLISAPIVPGFLPFGQQVDAACRHARYDTARLFGDNGERPAPLQRTLAEMRAAAAEAMLHVEGLDPVAFDRAADAVVMVEGEAVPGADYILHHSIPHFYFHLTAAILILRHHGVAIGDPDFLWGGASIDH